MYVKDNKTLREIGSLIDVSEKTLCQWKRDGDWERKRRDRLTSTRTAPAERLKERLHRLIEDPAAIDSKTADEIYKLLLSIEKIQGFDLKVATIEVMDRFTRFIRLREKDGVFIERLTTHIQAFFSEVSTLG